MTIEAMKLALEALEIEQQALAYEHGKVEHIENAITSLRQAIEQEQKQEPVAIVDATWNDDEGFVLVKRLVKNLPKGSHLYTSPPQRQPLTDEEIRKVKHHMVDGAYQYSFMQGVRYAEAAHGIKGEV